MFDILNEEKTYVINPKMGFQVYTEDITADVFDVAYAADGKDGLHMEFDISKDIGEDPNEASVTVYNLSEGTIGKLVAASNRSAPIEILLTESGKTDLVCAFRGEVDYVDTVFTNPGHETVINCTSQKMQHREFYIDRKTYKAGTTKEAIINDFLDIIGMPTQIETLPNDSILYSVSFTGPAFGLLKRFIMNEGVAKNCYINDGVLYISSIAEMENPIVTEIYKSQLLAMPNSTDYKDTEAVEMKTVLENSRTEYTTANKYLKKKKRNKGKVDLTFYNEYEAVDQAIKGMDFQMLCQPFLNPDDLINLPEYEALAKTIFRVREINSYGDTFGGPWNSNVSTEVYDTETNLLSGLF